MRNTFKPALFAGILLAGCATAYEGPSSDSPHASLEFHKGYPGGISLGVSYGQSYYHAPSMGAACSQQNPRLAKFMWTTLGSKTQRVAAGERFIVTSVTQTIVDTPGSSYGAVQVINRHSLECANTAHFTPQAGKTYIIEQNLIAGASCELNITENSTGEEPADIVHSKTWCSGIR